MKHLLDIGYLFIQKTDTVLKTPPQNIASLLVRCQIWGLAGNFCIFKNYFHFTLLRRKKYTKFHLISSILCCKFTHFKNVYEQRRYWCSINAIVPWHFIMKAFSKQIQQSFLLKKETEISLKTMTKYLSNHKPETEVQNTNQKNHRHTSKLQPIAMYYFSRNKTECYDIRHENLLKFWVTLTSAQAICGSKVLNLLFCLFPKLIFLFSPVCWTETVRLFLWKVVPMIWQPVPLTAWR